MRIIDRSHCKGQSLSIVVIRATDDSKPVRDTPAAGFCIPAPMGASMLDSAAALAPSSADQLVSFDGLCRQLGKSRPWIYERLNDPAERFPRPFKIGRRQYFRAGDVRAWLDAKTSGAQVAA